MRKYSFIVLLSTLLVTLLPCTFAQRFSNPTGARRLLNDLLLQAKKNPQLQGAALHFLRVVAEGEKDAISRESLSGFRVFEPSYRTDELATIRTRAKAFEHIGRLATPEALAYLESVDRSKYASSPEKEVMEKAIAVGIYLAQLGQITDQQRRWEFQAERLRHQRTDRGDAAVQGWAVAGLCADGALAFLPDVEAFQRRWRSNAEAEDRIQRCKAMMLLVASHPDRVTGLASALQLDAGTRNAELLRSWAIKELAAMNTRESRAKLQAFISEAEARIPPRDPGGNPPPLQIDLWNAQFLLANVMEP